jgi:type II secretory pathway component GspD/PulD (secretin)/beta-lactamase regulating signal transducer with metallopeptidase domain
MNWSSPDLMPAAGWTLVHFLWQGLAIAIVFAAALRLLRHSQANHRYLAGCFALVLMAAAPLITLSLLLPHNSARPAATSMRFEPVPVETAGAPMPMVVSQTPLVVTAKPEPQPVKLSVRLEAFFPWLVAGWITGVCLFSCRLFAGWLQICRLRRRTIQALDWSDRFTEIARKLGVSRSIGLLQSALVEVPTVIGWLRPVVLLPVSCVTGLSPGQLEAVIAHELAHIRRHDYLVNLFQSVVETLLFYHPAVWWVSRRIREEREHCCDDLAVAACGDRIGYARALAMLEELRPASAQLAVAASGAPLLRRIRRLVGQPERNPARAPWPVIGIVLVMILGMVAAGMRGHRAYAVTRASETTVDSRTENAPSTNRIIAGDAVSVSPGTESPQTTDSDLPEINIKVKFVELPVTADTDRSSALTNSILTDEQYRARINALSERDDTRILPAPEVTTESGRLAEMQPVDVDQIVTSTNLGFGSDGSTAFLFGPALDISAYVSKDGNSIWMSLISSVTNFDGNGSSNFVVRSPDGRTAAVLPLPHFRLRQSLTNLTLWDGQTVMVQGWQGETQDQGSPPKKYRNYITIFVTPTLVNPDGTAYNSPEERQALWTKPPPPIKPGNYLVSAPGAREQIDQKLHAVKVGQINYDGTTLKEVVDDLSKRMRSADSGGPDVGFVFFNIFPAPEHGEDIAQIKVRLNLQNASVADVLDAVVKTADHPIAYDVNEYGVCFSLRSHEPNPLEIRTFKINPDTFIRDLEGVVGMPSGGIGGFGGDYPRQMDGGQIANGSNGWASVSEAVPAFFKAAGVPLDSNMVVAFDDRKNTLTVRATSQDLDLIEAAMQMLRRPARKFQSGAAAQASGTTGGESVAARTANASSDLEIQVYKVNPATYMAKLRSAAGDSETVINSKTMTDLLLRYLNHAGVDFNTNSSSIAYDDRTGAYFLTATAEEMKQIDAALQAIDAAPSQTLIQGSFRSLNATSPEITVRVKFVELPAGGVQGLSLGSPAETDTNLHYSYDTNFMSYFGSNGAGAVSNAFDAFNHQKEPVASRHSRGGLIESNIAAPVTFTGILEDPQYRALLNALGQRDSVQILTLPSATTESGRSVKILSSKARSLVMGGPNGYSTTNMFFGPTLDITASASADGNSIELNLDPSISEFLGYLDYAKTSTNGDPGLTDYDGNPAHLPKSANIVPAVPVIETESLQSFATIKDGQTVVLGGLSMDEKVTMTSRVPVLGSIPIMGGLFRSKTSQNVRKPVLVFVTATLLNPDGTRYHSEK